jgi:hypothetical protein
MKYVSVYKGARSPFWYLSFLDSTTGTRRSRATPHRIDHPMGRRKALDDANDLSKKAAAFKDGMPNEIFEAWAEDYLKNRFRNAEATLTVAHRLT